MNEITNVLYWISTGLLIPVIAVLLILFVQVIVSAGGFISLFINRLKFDSFMKTWLADAKFSEAPPQIQQFNPVFFPFISRLITERQSLAFFDKVRSDFEIQADKELSKVKMASRLGPMLGLMGTLIPMGPALVGLASGDISSMAQNMQVAFSTTVVGIVIGAVGYVLQLYKSRWFTQDYNTLDFIIQTKLEDQEKGN